MADGKFSVIGKPLPKVDAFAKSVGATQYADDLIFPRMAYGKLLRSPHPHARIVRIDTSPAEKMPGVLTVITGKIMPIKFGIMPTSEDEEAMAIERVRYVGEPVAAVAAIDEETAEAATDAIVVEYEELPAILSIEDALAHEENRIQTYNRKGNIHKAVSFEFGNPEEGFAEADYTREDVLFFEGNTHLPMEQHAVVAYFGPDRKLTIWSSTQTPHYVHRSLAKVLEMPPSRIRVIAAPVGGGFGGKSDPFSHEFCAAKLSMITGRPVKVVLTREEVFYTHRGRHPVKMWVKTGVKKDGSITAMHFRSFLDGGAYGSYGMASVHYTGVLQTTTYVVPHYKFEGARLFTNKPPCGPKRGHGTVQPRFAVEVHLDKIADDLKLDPIEMRLNMLVKSGDITVNGLQITSCALRECIEKVRDASGWKDKFRKLPYGKGIGFAASTYITGAGLPIYFNQMPHTGVQIKIDRGGGVTVFCGSTDIGQGSDSVLAYVVAEELGVDLWDIRVVTADTDLTPVDLGSYSSRVTIMMGNAAIEACRKLKGQLFQVAAEMLQVPAAELVARGGRIFHVRNAEKGASFVEVANKTEARFGTLGATGSYTPPKGIAKYKGSGVGPTPAYTFCAAVVELNCDPDTGFIVVEKVWIAHDCGQAVNPLLAEGQIEGSVYMGLGEALMEEQAFRTKLGIHKIPSMLEYKSPTTLDTPEIITMLVENGDPEGPYGAKEAGQGPLLPVPPAVVNAVYDAVGVRIDEVPITPDKVFKALEAKAKRRVLKPISIPTMSYPEPVRWSPSELAVGVK